MSVLEAVESTVKKVVEEALQEMMSSLTDAYKEAVDVVDVAEQETILEVSKILEGKDRQGETLRRQIIGGAELTARNRSLQLIEEGVNNVFKEALQRLEDIASHKGYAGAMKKLLEESIDAIGGESLVVSGNKRDLEVLKKVAEEVGRERGVKIKVEKPIKTSGGIKAMTPDGSILYDNTFEARIERLRPVLRKEIAGLFGR